MKISEKKSQSFYYFYILKIPLVFFGQFTYVFAYVKAV